MILSEQTQVERRYCDEDHDLALRIAQRMSTYKLSWKLAMRQEDQARTARQGYDKRDTQIFLAGERAARWCSYVIAYVKDRESEQSKEQLGDSFEIQRLATYQSYAAAIEQDLLEQNEACYRECNALWRGWVSLRATGLLRLGDDPVVFAIANQSNLPGSQRN